MSLPSTVHHQMTYEDGNSYLLRGEPNGFGLDSGKQENFQVFILIQM